MLLTTEGELMPFLGVQRDTSGAGGLDHSRFCSGERKVALLQFGLLWQQDILSTLSLAVY